ncbi:MAG: DEAD/DEAH box helicase [Planctomycetes bacterium]|nr:DEAD/DEAH box helicase [Planctomycetota bacterium]
MGGPSAASSTCASIAGDRLAADAPLTSLRGVGEATAARLAAAGLATVGDLLLCFPRRHREVVPIDAPRDEFVGRIVRLDLRVTQVRRRFLRGRRCVVEVGFAAEDGASIRASFFDQPWLAKVFAPAQERCGEGRLERGEHGFELVGLRWLDARARDLGECSVQYRAIEGVSDARFRRLIDLALSRVDLDGLLPTLPHGLGAGSAPGVAATAALLRAMHSPRDAAEHEAARERFALIEAVALFRRLERARRLRAGSAAPRLRVEQDHDERLARVLGFALTGDQRRATEAIRTALARSEPMGCLLQGDVGTGKTAVALDAALVAIRAGHQVAFLAPTELLAEQHFERLAGPLASDGVRVAQLVGSLPARARRQVTVAIGRGDVDLVVGTHALFSATTRFAELGLVIVDEQHRFGVEQRARLAAKGRSPHVLVMTATPIPRTLALARFGDLDSVEVRDRPTGRPPARAVFVPRDAWPRVLVAIDRRVRRGDRVYVVCPRIGEAGEKGGAVRMAKELGSRARCGLVHGRMDAEERRATADRFRRGELDVLVGTTVLEVGVDVPEATLVVVVSAETFGLATLHQLRGRVGRGARRGLCILCGRATARTAAVVATTDGFRLAEDDLRLRGAGELCGARQSGEHDFGALDPLADYAILRAARDAVRAEAAQR